MLRVCEATIHHAALVHNVAQVRRFTPNAKIWAMVKANAYGHCMEPVAMTLQNAGVEALGVALVLEAIALRRSGIHIPIRVMQGGFSLEDWQQICEYDLEAVVHSPQQLDFLINNFPGTSFKFWIKLNLGMNRLGFPLVDLAQIMHRLEKKSQWQVCGLLGHFNCADELDNHATFAQAEQFFAATQSYALPLSLANSAAIIGWPDTHADWVRPGIMLYGVSPFANRNGNEFNLQPVHQLTSTVIATQNLKPGDMIGYGARFQVSRPSRIGVVGIGYGDGYPRHAADGTPVWVGNQKVPLVGRVSMDILTVDLTDSTQVQIGDTVELWGSNLPIEQVAQAANTISYELLCKLTARVNVQHLFS